MQRKASEVAADLREAGIYAEPRAEGVEVRFESTFGRPVKSEAATLPVAVAEVLNRFLGVAE